MRLILLVSAVAILSCAVEAGCPFAGSLAFGQQRQPEFEQSKADLIGQKLLISPGMPASGAWGSRPMSVESANAFNQSIVLLLAQQIYLQTCPISGDIRPSEALQLLAAEVPLSERRKPTPICNSTYPYALPSGACNKLSQPNEGASFTPYSRLLPATYDDGLYTIRKAESNSDLPSPRDIGNKIAVINPFNPAPAARPNAGAVMWGQYITHDMSFRQIYQQNSGGPGLRCCTADNKRVLPEQLRYHGCYPITVPSDDEFYSQFGIGCLEFMRSQPGLANDGSLGTVQISSSVTHHMDNSNIYGSTADQLNALRTFQGGEMLNSAAEILPRRPGCTGPGCYFTGDIRGAGFPTLALWHSVCLRLHNILARQLRTVNPQWDDERTFQESRRLLMAIYQSVSYNEWVPLVLGTEESSARNITCDKKSTYCGWYDETVASNSMNEWAVAAFRVMHGNTPPVVNLYNSAYNTTKSIPLEDNLRYGTDLLETEMLGVLRGLLKDSALFDKYPDVLRSTIFKDGNKNGLGLDLLSVDIARGRDHGLAPYTVHAERCLGRKINKWFDLKRHIPSSSIKVLQSLYTSVHDVDLFVGLLLEEKRNVVLGPVARCLLAEQLYRTKNGDRFFYSLPNGANPFSVPQLDSIHTITFADVLCITTGVEAVPARAFEQISATNPLQPCSNRTIDFGRWRE